MLRNTSSVYEDDFITRYIWIRGSKICIYLISWKIAKHKRNVFMNTIDNIIHRCPLYGSIFNVVRGIENLRSTEISENFYLSNESCTDTSEGCSRKVDPPNSIIPCIS